MTSNAERADRLILALVALFECDPDADDLFTRNVRGSAPGLEVGSEPDLAAALATRRGACSDVELDVWPLDVGLHYAVVEWVAQFTHTGPLPLRSRVVDATGRRLRLHGVVVGEFDGNRVSSFRVYWDEAELLSQLTPPPPRRPFSTLWSRPAPDGQPAPPREDARIGS